MNNSCNLYKFKLISNYLRAPNITYFYDDFKENLLKIDIRQGDF